MWVRGARAGEGQNAAAATAACAVGTKNKDIHWTNIGQTKTYIGPKKGEEGRTKRQTEK